MATYTSTLPDKLLAQLDQTAKQLKIPKNKLIEKALNYYLEQMDKAAYKASFQRASKDPDMIEMAEEGLKDYVEMLEKFDNED